MKLKQIRELIKSRYPDLNKLSFREKSILNQKYGFNIPLPRRCKICKSIVENNFMEHLRQVHNLENKFYNPAIVKGYYYLSFDFDFCTIPQKKRIADFEN